MGSIIGKRGDHVKLIRDKSGAKVNISDGSCPERIVTITGNTTTINSAFGMVARKFEEVRICCLKIPFTAYLGSSSAAEQRAQATDHNAANCAGHSMRIADWQRRLQNQGNPRGWHFLMKKLF